MSQKVKDALAATRAANEALSDTVKAEYPIGAPIAWTRGGAGKAHKGEVITHGYGSRLWVRNLDTGRDYWIHASDIHH